MCGKGFKEALITSDAAKLSTASDSLTLLAYLRVLADFHPLQQPFPARLTPQYKSDMVIAWRLKDFITGPIDILQTLGVDVFADYRYDTRVLQTIWWD
jgi:hypothetical protein